MLRVQGDLIAQRLRQMKLFVLSGITAQKGRLSQFRAPTAHFQASQGGKRRVRHAQMDIYASTPALVRAIL